MLKDLFEIPKCKDDLSIGQKQWLQMVGNIPNIKLVMGQQVRKEDIELSNEANEILAALA